MNKIEIRRAGPDDAAAFSAILGQDGVMPNTLQLPFPSPDKWRQRLVPNDKDFILVAEVDGVMVGHGGVHLADGRRRVHAASIGMTVGEAWQGKGVGTALLKAAIDLAENWLGITRLELTVFSDNSRAIGLYRKFGFIEEGLQREYAMRGGAMVDALLMARLSARSQHALASPAAPGPEGQGLAG